MVVDTEVFDADCAASSELLRSTRSNRPMSRKIRMDMAEIFPQAIAGVHRQSIGITGRHCAWFLLALAHSCQYGSSLGRSEVDIARNEKYSKYPDKGIDFQEFPSSQFHDGVRDEA